MLKGYKTYLFSALAVIWTLIYIWGWLPITPEWFLSVLTVFGGGTVYGIRDAL